MNEKSVTHVIGLFCHPSIRLHSGAALSLGRGLQAARRDAVLAWVRGPLTCVAHEMSAALLHSSPQGEECCALLHGFLVHRAAGARVTS
jgi:hypothetical protein